MNYVFERLDHWLKNIATAIDNNISVELHTNFSFLNEQQLALHLIDLIANITEDEFDATTSYYSDCVYALEICISQLQNAKEHNNKIAAKTLDLLMRNIAAEIRSGNKNINFWLPILNAFYDVNIVLLPELKDAYFDIAKQEDELYP